jgi:16S rRNA (cytosine1402-N4)-methyltransferase
MIKSKFHEPVLVREVLTALKLDAPLKKTVRIIDATVGTAGHALKIVKCGGDVLGIDEDRRMLEMAEERLEKACPTLKKKNSLGSYILIHGNFKDIDKIAWDNHFESIDGIVFDLGVSNLQLTSLERGFSFANPEADLDMRVDPEIQAVKGADLLNVLRKDQLQAMFGEILKPFEAKKLSREVIRFRQTAPIRSVGDFLTICNVIRAKPGLSQATLPFLALRIAVNSELDNLSEALPKAFSLLRPGGRLVIITFHSAEDAIVKNFYQESEKGKMGIVINRKPIEAGEQEIAVNPKARSAKLRIFERKK